jgi:hypothetical protein
MLRVKTYYERVDPTTLGGNFIRGTEDIPEYGAALRFVRMFRRRAGCRSRAEGGMTITIELSLAGTSDPSTM